MAFHVGQRVVCISGVITNWDDYAQGEDIPQVGQVYTIRDIDRVDGWLMFEEIINSPREYATDEPTLEFGECNFAPEHFRPLVSTNIDVFLKMLTPEDQFCGG